MTMSSKSSENGHFGERDTTLTKVFVGGLAWETPKEAMHDHFHKYGEIVEAVIIVDKISGRSKGYGFVTFKDPEAAKKACEDATPTINGRRANCNLAALGARRPSRSSSSTPPLQQNRQPATGGGNVVRVGPTSGNAGHVQWFYSTPPPPAGSRASTAPSFQPQPHPQPLPFYPAGYSAAYISAHEHVSYNNKVNYNNNSGGACLNGPYTQMYPNGHQAMITGTNTMVPVYPFYPYAHQQAHHPTMGLPAPFFQPTSSGPIITSPPIISKPTTPVCIQPPPTAVCLTVE